MGSGSRRTGRKVLSPLPRRSFAGLPPAGRDGCRSSGRAPSTATRAFGWFVSSGEERRCIVKGTGQARAAVASNPMLRSLSLSCRTMPFRAPLSPPSDRSSHDGYRPAGVHLLVDLWEAEGLDDAGRVEAALVEAASACGATVLQVNVHGFPVGRGVTGVALLAESHISIHSWPEHRFAAIDVFVCGTCDAHAVLPVFRRAFRPGRVEVNEHRRGLVPPSVTPSVSKGEQSDG